MPVSLQQAKKQVMRKSAGILLYRIKNKDVEFFLIHPGGPVWVNKDAGAWSIPKGEFTEEELPLAAAKREFQEETGTAINGHFIELTPIKQKGGKMVYAWAVEGNMDAEAIQSNTFTMQWPPKSGQWKTYAEVDKSGWFNLADAKQKINEAQIAFLEQVAALLNRQS